MATNKVDEGSGTIVNVWMLEPGGKLNPNMVKLVGPVDEITKGRFHVRCDGYRSVISVLPLTDQ
jgi:hypothetical protein